MNASELRNSKGLFLNKQGEAKSLGKGSPLDEGQREGDTLLRYAMQWAANLRLDACSYQGF